VGAWNYLGTIAYTTRRYADAESYFRKALEKDPDSYSPLVNLGGALLALDRTEESLEVNRKAVRAKPDDPLAQSQLGMSYYYLGRYEEAESHLKQAKSLDAGHFTLPQILLASIYERRRDPEAAIRELEDFLKRHPDSDRAPAVRIKIDALRLESTKKDPLPG
jgi:tetratricopeptide (TPR) repeat protein